MADKRLPRPSLVLSPQSLDLLDNIQFGEIIGSGTFGNVLISIDPTCDELYAVKRISVDRLDQPQYDLIQNEVRNMKSLDYPGLLKLKTSLTWSSFIVMVMPLMQNRSCDQIVRNAYPTGIPEPAVGCIMKDVLNAVTYLHTRNIVHRSIKASHILISESGAAVLSGFRYLLQIPPNQTRINTGNNTLGQMSKYINWMSPEILKQFKARSQEESGMTKALAANEDLKGIGLNSDMYSLGITICEIANGVVPYSEVSPSGILVKKLEEAPPKLWDKNFLPSQESGVPGGILRHPQDQPYKRKLYSQYIHKFVSVCLVSEPEARINYDAAQKMKFITTYAKESPTETLRHLHLMGPPLQFRPQPEAAAQPVAHSSQDSEEEWKFP